MDKVAFWLGLIGTITGVVSLIWQIVWAVHKNKSRLKLDIGVRPDKGDKGGYALDYKINLVGDKPIRLLMWGVCDKKGENLHNFPNKGVTLFEPGSRHKSFLMRKREMQHLEEFKDIDFEYGFIKDDAGNILIKKIKY